MPNNIRNAENTSLVSAYSTWHDDVSFAKASKELGKALNNVQPIHKSSAAIANRFQGIDANTSVRDTYSSLDYAFFRPNEQVPKFFRDVISGCMGAYQKVPVVKNVIDLMGDFTCQGIKLIHKDEKIQNFYREWWRKVGGEERSERIANVLYRCGNVIVKRADAKLNAGVATDWKKTVAETDLTHEDDVVPNRYEVPYRYTILNPLIVEVLGEHVAAFTGKVHYVLKLPATFYNTLSLPLMSFDPSLLTEGMPRDLQQAMDRNDKYLLLDSDKLVCLFYKKDDWDVWAYPILYSLLDEIILLQKMKQADMTALDGVISHIRVWKLGSLEHKIFPNNAAITKLSNILLNNLGGGAMDLIWGPDLELDSTSTDIMNFLGSEKYEFVMNQIHSGLGVPAAIGKSKGTMSDNFMSLKVLVERLKYGRQVLKRFWEGEIRRVQQAMGFKEPAKVMFEYMNLSDDPAVKSLWLQLVDRDIVPVEAVQELFGRDPEIDNLLIKREYASRAAGDMPVKVSPYVDAQPKLSLEKIALQRGMIGPEQVGLEVPPPSNTEEQMFKSNFPDPVKLAQTKTANKVPGGPSQTVKKKPKGVSGQGRPTGKKDGVSRDQRTPKPLAKATEFIQLVTKAKLYQGIISSIVDEYYLDKFSKSAIAELTPDEGVELAKFKYNLLLNCSAEKTPTREVVEDMLNDPLVEYDNDDYQKLCSEFVNQKNRPLTPQELADAQCYIYALLKIE